MLHINDPIVRAKVMQYEIGLERENLRILPDGAFSHVLHPFGDEETHVVYDFCENQLEVNTSVASSEEEAVSMLADYTRKIQKRLAELPEPELLWPFSNPSYIRDEDDIPIARNSEITGHNEGYREYLASRYGRYKMTFSGIHVNFSFAEDLLRADFSLSAENDFQTYKNKLYLHVAEGAFLYGWILTAITAASPLLDGSYLEKGVRGKTVFNGMASIRCSEMGYWNLFTAILDYSSIQGYADSIRKYVENGMIIAPSELYYPIRLKPKGKNTMENLEANGVNHIELRMVDLNPLEFAGINEKDLQFIRLFLIWIASTEHKKMGAKEQVDAVGNFKHAAHYDLSMVKVLGPYGECRSMEEVALKMIQDMREFYKEYFKDIEDMQDIGDESGVRDIGDEYGIQDIQQVRKIQEVLAFEEAKFTNPETRYAWKIRKEFGENFLGKGLKLAEEWQKSAGR